MKLQEQASSNRTFMELKPVHRNTIKQSRNSSNRTFMELKHTIFIRKTVKGRVLIAPLWN